MRASMFAKLWARLEEASCEKPTYMNITYTPLCCLVNHGHITKFWAPIPIHTHCLQTQASVPCWPKGAVPTNRREAAPRVDKPPRLDPDQAKQSILSSIGMYHKKRGGNPPTQNLANKYGRGNIQVAKPRLEEHQLKPFVKPIFAKGDLQISIMGDSVTNPKDMHNGGSKEWPAASPQSRSRKAATPNLVNVAYLSQYYICQLLHVAIVIWHVSYYTCFVPSDTFSVVWLINGESQNVIGDEALQRKGITASVTIATDGNKMYALMTVEARAGNDMTLQCLAVIIGTAPVYSEVTLLRIHGDIISY